MLTGNPNFELFFEHAADALFVSTSEGNLVSANECFRRIVGCSLDEVETLPLSTFLRCPAWGELSGTVTSGPTEETWFEWQARNGDLIRLRGKIFVDDKTGQLCGLFRAHTVTRLSGSQETSSDPADPSALLRELIVCNERERERLAGSIHDGLVQHIVGAQLWLETIRDAIGDASPTAKEACATVQEATRAAIEEARQVIQSLHPFDLETADLKLGLTSVVEEYQLRSKGDVGFALDGDIPKLDTLTVDVALRIFCEVVERAQVRKASSVSAVIRCEDELVLVIDVETKTNTGGEDCFDRQEQILAAALGGRLHQSQTEQGFTVNIHLPVGSLEVS